MAKEFERVFKSKTGVAWAQRGASGPVQGKYQHGSVPEADGVAVATGGSAPSELQMIRQAGASNPSNAAHQLALRGLFDEGISFARLAVDRSPNGATDKSNLGYFCLARQAFGEAEAMLKQSVALSDLPLSVANLGLCLALRAKKGKASSRGGGGEVKFSNEVAALIAKAKGKSTLTAHQGGIWQYRNNLAKVWEQDAADDESGGLANDVVVVRAFAAALE